MRCLIVVAKAPIAGLVKTRLAATIGAERTLALYRCFLADTLALASAEPACALAISFWPPEAASQFSAIAPNALLLPQQGIGFGDRLLSAFTQASDAGFDQMVLIGSDNPSLPPRYVSQAFDALESHETVLGPSEDGGYYLIGMREPQPELFGSEIAWSTEIVAQQTRAAVRSVGLRLAEVPIWYDIDTADDLRRLYNDTQRGVGNALQTGALLHSFARNGLADLLIG